MKLYWTSIEYAFDAEHEQAGAYEGGYVYALVMADDARDALEKFSEALAKEKMTPTEIEFIAPYKSVSWETDEENEKFDAMKKEARASEAVVFDDFFVYEGEETTPDDA